MKTNDSIAGERLDCSSYKRMVRSLQAKGLHVRTFKRTSKKSLRQLFDETQRNEVVLVWDAERRRIVRCASAARLLITACKGRYVLLERRREYPPTRPHLRFLNWLANLCFRWFGVGRPDPLFRSAEHHNWWSLSETVIRGETGREAAVRGAAQECDITLEERTLERLSGPAYEDEDEHESSTYPSIWSSVALSWFKTDLSEKPDKEESFVVDNGVKIYHVWEDTQTRGSLSEPEKRSMQAFIASRRSALLPNFVTAALD